MKLAEKINLNNEEQALLRRWSQGRRVEARQKERAEIILLCAEGMQTVDVAQKLGLSRQKVAR